MCVGANTRRNRETLCGSCNNDTTVNAQSERVALIADRSSKLWVGCSRF